MNRCQFPAACCTRQQVLLSISVPLLVCLLATAAPAGEVQLKNGFAISGTPLQIEGLSVKAIRSSAGNVRIKHVWMIDDGMRRYFVPQRQVPRDSVDRSSLVPYDEYTLRHLRAGREIGPSIVGTFAEITPFDRFGRRRVTLTGAQGPIPILQAITRIRPDYVTVESTSHKWEYGLSTWTIPPDVLDSLLKQAADPNNASDRLGIARFYIDAEMYGPAQAELAAMLGQFPQMRERIEETQRELAHFIALKALGEIRQRQAAGQHRLAFAVADGFPQEMVSADLRREARELADAYRRQADEIAKAKVMLAMLESELPEEDAAAVRPLRSVINDELTFDTLPRLEPFLRAEQDDTLQADEKLALAYSGWLLGSSRADLALPAAIRLWRMRFLVLQYLRSSGDADRRAVLRDLSGIDGADVPTLAGMIPQLAPAIDAPPPQPGIPMTVELQGQASDSNASEQSVRYSVILPLEYTPLRSYPMIVALRSQGTSREHELTWWAGSAAEPGHAMKRGYIVIAPEYAAEDDAEYDYSLTAHTAVLASIRDARKRFSVDSNRIFLAGHGMGGDAAFDIGMSQPDLFAGVMPITGICEKYCRWTWENADRTAWYVVGGERDRDSLEVNAQTLNRMMVSGDDLVCCEYVARGYESYFEELPRLFDWMPLHQRQADQREFKVDVLRPTATQWYWLRVDEFPQHVLQPVVWEKGAAPPRPQKISGSITPGNTIRVGSAGQRAVIKLSPELIDFDQRVHVVLRNRSVHRDFVKPDIAALLEDLRERGDRQRLYWARLEF